MARSEYPIRRVAKAFVVIMNLEGVLYAYAFYRITEIKCMSGDTFRENVKIMTDVL
jgi:hypothetical protein